MWTEQWAREAFRVLKPGAHAVVCGAPRAYHRMACGLEDAGFEIRDCLAWLFGSGFPKSLNLGEGLGTALKPAHEPIVLARKPFKGTVKGNVEKHGTGAMNIDAARIPFASDEDQAAAAAAAAQRTSHNGLQGTSTFARTGDVQESIDGYVGRMDLGRWPANVCLDDLAAMVLDEQSGERVSTGGTGDASKVCGGVHGWTPSNTGGFGDIGGASRFYYIAKPSREERDFGCGRLPTRSAGELTGRKEGSPGQKHGRSGTDRVGRNYHPTVKPVELMRWLVKLVTPINGTVIDPFLGSGTTGMACKYEQRNFIGIEREAEYIAIAEARIGSVAPLFSEASA
jgi:site-specific DNA-methyltransferase (adenine-specific)